MAHPMQGLIVINSLWPSEALPLLNRYGKAGVQFFTQPKTITSKWNAEDVALCSSPGVGSKAASGTSSSGRIPGLDRVGA